MTTPHIIIREVATDELRIVLLPVGYSCAADPSYRWAGWFDSEQSARNALRDKDEDVRLQLYGKPRVINGTPGPQAVAELFRI